MKQKLTQYEAKVKALTNEDGTATGEFEAVVAVFDNVDKHGDRLKSTAFDATLEAWREKGGRIPVILSHGWDDPFKIIGSADPADVKAIPGRGLYAKGIIEHMDENPTAAQVYRLMKSGLLTEFSFGYTVPKGGETKAADGAYDLSEVNLIEFGPCLKGVNPDTELLAVKSMSALLAEEHPNLKSYVDVEVEGSFEEVQEALRNAIAALYPSPQNGAAYQYASVVATTPSTVTFQVCRSGYGDDTDGDRLYQATYEVGEDGVASIGDATEVQAVIQPKADTDIETKADTDTEDAETETKAACPGCNALEQTFGKECAECGEMVAKAEEAPAPEEPKALTPEESAQLKSDVDLMLYESALENLEAGIKLKPFDSAARETAALDAQLDAQLLDLL